MTSVGPARFRWSSDANVLRVVIVSYYDGPARGGLFERLNRLHLALAERGADVHVITRRPPSRSTLRLHFVSCDDGRAPSFTSFVAGLRRARGIATAKQATGFLSFGSVYTAGLRLARVRRPIVTFLRGSWPEQERAQGGGALRLWFVRALERWALESGGPVLAVSSSVVPHGVAAEILPNDAPAISRGQKSSARAQLSLTSDGYIVGALGSASPIKSLETTVAAVREEPGSQLVLANVKDSSGRYADSIRRALGELGGRGHALGWVNPQTFLSAVDVCVLASRHEGCPNALLEAMAAGVPCLGARSPGIEEMLRHEELLFPFGDAAALRGKLFKLRTEPAMRALNLELSADRVRDYQFDWDERAASAVLAAFRSASAAS